MTNTIISPRDVRYSARLAETNNGVRVEIWRAAKAGGGIGVSGVAVRIHHDTIDVPFHVACDLMHAMLCEIEEER